MIVRLDKDRAFTKDISGKTFFYNEYGFGIAPERREKVKFLEIENNKDLDFLGTLELRAQWWWDALTWIKNNKL